MRTWTIPICLAPAFALQVWAAVRFATPVTILNAITLALVLGFMVGLRLAQRQEERRR